jgi:hypothetical protein
MLNPQGGQAALGLDEWRTLLIDGRLMVSSGEPQSSLLRAGFREARFAFYWSRMCITDEIKSRAQVLTTTMYYHNVIVVYCNKPT